MDNDVWKIFSPAAGIWALVAMAAVALFRAWPLILEKLNERQRDLEAAKDGDWRRLRDEITRLDERFKRHVEEAERKEALQLAENEKCRSDLAAVRDELAVERAERMKFERLLQGEGEIRQAASIAAAEVRLEKKEHK